MADVSKGWITLLRSIQEHQFWKIRPFDKARAWIDMILTANHKENKTLIGNQTIKINRGQLLTSQLKLSKRWGWSREKVRNFLGLLSNEKMIELKTHIQKDKGFSLITIINYNDLQKQEKDEKTTKPTTNRQLTDNKPDTNNNVNNVNNIKEGDFPFLKDPSFHSTWRDYLDMRKRLRKVATERAQELVLKELHKHDLKTAIAMLEQSIVNSWQGVFPLKTAQTFQGKNTPASTLTDQAIEKALGKIATKDMIKDFLRDLPQPAWAKVSYFLNKRFPGDGSRAYSLAEREIIAETRQMQDKITPLLKGIGDE